MNEFKTIIESRKLKLERPLVEPKWSDTQCNDMARMLEMVDSLIATAVASHQSQHQYNMLQTEKAEFIREFLDTAEKYRVLVNEH